MDTKLYCVKCKSKQNGKNYKVLKTKNNKHLLQANCVNCNTKMNRFLSAKDMSGNGLLSMLGIKIPGLQKIPILGSVLG